MKSLHKKHFRKQASQKMPREGNLEGISITYKIVIGKFICLAEHLLEKDSF